MAAGNKTKADPIRQMQGLKRDLQEGRVQSIYLFYGEEGYLRSQCVDMVKSALFPEDDTMNITAFSGEHLTKKAILDLADTMPFFADRRLIIVEDSGFFTAAHDELAAYISEGIPETTCLIFSESKADSRMKLFKAAAKAGMTMEMTLPREQHLTGWLAKLARAAGKNISADVLEHFLEISAPDMVSMKNEMQKVLDYTGERNTITRDDIDAVCTVNVENRVFEMIDAVAEKDSRTALRLYDALLTLREPPMRILYNMNSQFSRLYQIKDLLDKGLPIRAISDRTGIRDFIVRRSLRPCERFSLEGLREALEYGVQMEEDIKTGKITDSIAVETMIVRFCQ